MKTILLVEDDDDDVYLFKQALADIQEDIKIMAVGNGVECMKLLRESPLPDLVFMDINMPLKNGLVCLEEIRNEKKLSRLKVVVLSTASTKKIIDLAYAKGADLYIPKSIDFERFRDLLIRCCSHDLS